MGRKESNQTKKKKTHTHIFECYKIVCSFVSYPVQNNIHFRNTFENIEYLPNKIYLIRSPLLVLVDLYFFVPFGISIGMTCCIATVTYIRVTRNSNKIPILNSNNTVVYLTQVNEGNSISFIYRIGFYRCFGIHSVFSLLFT